MDFLINFIFIIGALAFLILAYKLGVSFSRRFSPERLWIPAAVAFGLIIAWSIPVFTAVALTTWMLAVTMIVISITCGILVGVVRRMFSSLSNLT